MRAARVAAAASAALVSTWGLACGLLYLRAFAPAWRRGDQPFTPADFGIDHETIEMITSDGVQLAGWYCPGRLPAALVISGGHRGRASDVLGIAAVLADAGFHVLVYGWRGTPGSDPAAHTLGVHERLDLQAAIDALVGRLGDVPIGLLGYSLGGAVSITVAADDPRVVAVCADSAFSDPRDVLGDGVWRVIRIPAAVVVAPVAMVVGRRTGAHLADFCPLRAVERIAPRPLLLIHGEADEMVRPYHAHRLRAAAGPTASLWLVPGAGHAGGYFVDRVKYSRRVVTFFRESMLGASPSR